jgi:hypothetical protein
MGFLYQHRGVGKAGIDSNKIDVRDVPAMKTLSYTWQGKNNSSMMKTAQKAIAAELEKRGIKSDHYRVLGYNGPGVAHSKKTWELVAVLPK